MSHHKKRVYPQAQYQLAEGLAQPMAGAGAPTQPVAPGQQPFLTPAQQHLHQQIDQATAGLGNMQLHNVPVVDPNSFQQAGAPMGQAYPQAYQQPVQPMQQQQQLPMQQQTYQQQQYQQPGVGVGAGMGVSVGKPMNQLYPVDLFQELPPPITDLSLPPPPLMVPPEKMIVPNETVNHCSEHLRCTMNAIPKNGSLLKKSKLPLAMVIRPYTKLIDADAPTPTTPDGVVVRCRRCRAYLNPFVQIIENGLRYRCAFCNLANTFPQQIDMNGNRYERPEFNSSIVDFVAPKEYAVRPPPPSTYAFVLDVSQAAIKNGLLATTARTLLESLDTIPNHDERTRISIICVDQSLHFFRIPLDEEGDNIKMYDVADLDEPFLPSPSGLLVPLIEARNNIEKLLTSLPEIFQQSIQPKFSLAPALKSALNLIRAQGGKIIVVGATLPNVGEGTLHKRNEKAVANTSKEASTLLNTGDAFYKSFPIECNKFQVAVDVFMASDDYVDIASVSNLGRFTGGQTHFYPGFSALNLIDVTKFSKEFSKHVSMDLSFETVMRARASSGLKMTGFYGHFFNRSSDLCALPAIPRDQSYVLELGIDEQLTKEYVYLQVALLLTSNVAQRRIRVITLAIPTTDKLTDVYASADQLAITAYYAQKGVERAPSSGFEDTREFLNKSVQEVLATYKKEVLTSNTGGAAPLMLCANLRMWPLLMHSLTKHMAFRSGIVPADHRAHALNNLETLPLPYLIQNIYPTVYSLHDMPDEAGLPHEETGEIVLPQPINSTSSLLERYGLYLIDTGLDMFLWIGGDAVPELVTDVFGTPDIMEIPIGKNELPVLDATEFNLRVRNVISKIREHDDVIFYKTLHIVRGASPSEPMNHVSAREVASLRLWTASQLVEDKVQNSWNYREFLQNMKTRISK